MAYPKSTALLILLFSSSLFPSSSFSSNLLHQSISSPLSLAPLSFSLPPPLFLSRSLYLPLPLLFSFPLSFSLVSPRFLSGSVSLSLSSPLSLSLSLSLSLCLSLPLFLSRHKQID